MTEDYDDRARLEINARSYRYDPNLDRVADLIEAGDRAALAALPPQYVGQAQIHSEFRRYYREAVAAGVIPDNRGSNAVA